MTRALYRRAKEAILTGWYIPVLGVLCVGLLDTDHNENVLEVGANATWGEGFAAFLLEDHRHNVIANVTLPQQLQIQKHNTNILSHTWRIPEEPSSSSQTKQAGFILDSNMLKHGYLHIPYTDNKAVPTVLYA